MIRSVMAALALCALLAGCEKSQQAAYRDGRYAGKADTRAWDNAPFNGDRAAWERTIKARNVRQNEYERTLGRGV